ncbi:hypothetical protein K470DRAFT_256504 [Piedraia hortae CBS 480.64]|uniref:Uncharacterized protein n=1 Tax=Piedraia hortae CBS 480.64 TaxID=1314780 RepID=A0A6A7C385_9PEZI|nr:hypothetical protein K470DRAFT_256504 [Piedraia hortae CBS 480.64]
MLDKFLLILFCVFTSFIWEHHWHYFSLTLATTFIPKGVTSHSLRASSDIVRPSENVLAPPRPKGHVNRTTSISHFVVLTYRIYTHEKKHPLRSVWKDLSNGPTFEYS